MIYILDDFSNTKTFLIKKKSKDRNLIIKLRIKSKIIILRKLFQLSRKIKYNDFIVKNVFIIISKYNPYIKSYKIFKSRIINKVKDK